MSKSQNPKGTPGKNGDQTTRTRTGWNANDDQAYLAAELAFQGLCAAKIAREVFGHSTAADIQRIPLLLHHAAKRKWLVFNPPVDGDAEKKLAARFHGHIKFHVVNNDQVAQGHALKREEEFRGDAIGRIAAEIVADRIYGLLSDRTRGDDDIVIANAGGVAVRRVLKFLEICKRIPEKSKPSRLLFISLNAAAMPADFGCCANVLAVRAADIYGGRHLALSPIWPNEERDVYKYAVSHIDLLLCGAGARSGLLFHWLQNHVDITLPPKAVGDICLVPINAEGRPVSLEKKVPQRVEEILRPHPTYDELQSLASLDKIVYVAMGYENDDRRRDPDADPKPVHSKLEVTRAILHRTLTKTCILGTTLADDILDEKKSSRPGGAGTATV